MPTLFVWLIVLLFIGELNISLCFRATHPIGTNRQQLVSNRVKTHQCQAGADNNNEILGAVRFDYSAANEYIRAHYGEESPRLPLYFGKEECMETVYDARYGVYTSNPSSAPADANSTNTNEKQQASLKTCGFVLISPSDFKECDKRDDWNNWKWIQQHYLPPLQKHLQELYSGQRTIRHMLFWNPMLRGPPNKPRPNTDSGKNADPIKTPKASYAALPHIDMDVNAYHQFEDFLDLMENNEMEILDATTSGKTRNVDHYQQRRKDILDSIQDTNRGFCIVNAWCNVGSHPVTKDPLGLFSVRYDDTAALSTAAFPLAAPNMKTSRWYAFSDMVPNEVLIFCQYDRDASWPSDLWHCSLDGISTKCTQEPARESFDIRCLLVFEEEVPFEQDRFQRANRLGSLLSLEESGCFCEGQFDKRQKEDAVSD